MKINNLIISFNIILSLTFFFCSCQPNNSKSADIVLRNGFIYIVDSSNSIAQSVAIKDGKLTFVGSDSGASQFIGERTKVIDFENRMVLPGFIDAHCHPISSYRYFNELNLYDLKTIPEIQKAIKKYLLSHPNAKYIKGRGWSDTDFPKTGPNKKIIDEIVKDIPVSFSSDGLNS